MRHSRWLGFLGLSLIAFSLILYIFHYAAFRDLHHILIFMLGDLAFLPIEVLLVTLVVHRLLGEREKRIRLKKLNMVIGVFYSEAGTKLLSYFSDLDPKLDEIRKYLIVTEGWSEKEFLDVSGHLRNYDYGVEIHRIDLENLRKFLLDKRDFLIGLLVNPTLLEHETFTDLLQSVFHLTEELTSRDKVIECSDADCEHLKKDIERVYVFLVYEWLSYMEHLKDNYPALFSLAMRVNPFDQDASAEFK
ncbi:MAG: hypothetical protein V3R86_04360 [Candidatus Hydrothermarchaeaceae archaeon]